MRIFIMGHEGPHFSDEIFNALECSTADSSLSGEIKPNFNLIEPRSVSRRVVDLMSRLCCEPSLNGRVPVGSVIINHQMNVQVSRNAGINLFKKLKILLMVMTLFAARQYFPGSNVERSK